MKRRLFIFAFMLIAAAADERPGWLGFGFAYHRAVPPAEGWMYVRAVAPSSPAAKVGLKTQDVITHINGAPLRYAKDEEVLAALAKIRAGDRVKFRVRRGTAAMEIVVTAAPMSDEMWHLWQRNQATAKTP